MSALPFRRIACGMSGGVDSAVSAFLLKNKGFEVSGVFMKNWDIGEEEGPCDEEAHLEDARSICNHLEIDLVEVSFVKEYWNDVFTCLVEEYENGMTPNPDVLCNRYIKFGSFFNYAINKLGADAIATGHYVRTTFGPFLQQFKKNESVDLLRAFDPVKDQTLFLSQVDQNALRKSMFPLGQYYKSAIRKIAADIGLDRISKKKDSVGICFIGDRTFPNFIAEYIEPKNGFFVDVETGETVGEHQGVHKFTIGQRCKLSGFKKAYYVTRRDPATQIIYVAAGWDNIYLFSNEIITQKPHWISTSPLVETYDCMFRFQHTEWMIPCTIRKRSNDSEDLLVRLALPTRAVTPGQYAVFYKGDVCLGSAKILSVELKTDTSNN